MSRVVGKVAIVTGGGLGIGRATATLLAKEGAKVAVTDILDDEGAAVAKDIRDSGGEASFWHMDVTKEEEVRSVFADICERLGGIDILVNNAGIAGVDKPTHEITGDEWDRVMRVNVKGVFLCTKHAVPVMKSAGRGSIVNLSSIYGIISAPDLPAYHASKGAVRLMTKTDALLYARDNIRVNSVHPGFIWTPLVEDLARESEEGLEAFREHLDELHPIGQVGQPEDVAYGVLYLASEESKFMTGSELVIDGGYTCR
jgi:NAD(P)-dependent dehydrogenase (short-subunit alcohol dehydrogenase family)